MYMRPEYGIRRMAAHWPKWKLIMTSRFVDIASTSDLFDLAYFILSNRVTGPGFLSISLLILQLWQLLFITYWQEIQKSETNPSQLCAIFRDWGELWIPNLAGLSLLQSYWMLKNVGVTAFTVSQLLVENQQGGRGWNYSLLHSN